MLDIQPDLGVPGVSVGDVAAQEGENSRMRRPQCVIWPQRSHPRPAAEHAPVGTWQQGEASLLVGQCGEPWRRELGSVHQLVSKWLCGVGCISTGIGTSRAALEAVVFLGDCAADVGRRGAPA